MCVCVCVYVRISFPFLHNVKWENEMFCIVCFISHIWDVVRNKIVDEILVRKRNGRDFREYKYTVNKQVKRVSDSFIWLSDMDQ